MKRWWSREEREQRRAHRRQAEESLRHAAAREARAKSEAEQAKRNLRQRIHGMVLPSPEQAKSRALATWRHELSAKKHRLEEGNIARETLDAQICQIMAYRVWRVTVSEAIPLLREALAMAERAVARTEEVVDLSKKSLAATPVGVEAGRWFDVGNEEWRVLHDHSLQEVAEAAVREARQAQAEAAVLLARAEAATTDSTALAQWEEERQRMLPIGEEYAKPWSGRFPRAAEWHGDRNRVARRERDGDR